MGSSFQVIAFLLLSNILSISTATRVIEPDCGSCTKPPVVPVVPLPPVHEPKVPVTPGIVPPVTIPKLPVPPVTVIVPPVTVPIVPVLPPVVGALPLPPIPTVPIVGGVLPPVTVPTVPIVGGVVPIVGGVVPIVGGVVPPVTVPTVPIVGGVLPLPHGSIPPVVVTTPKKFKPCAPPAHKKATCPVNTLKLGACASALGGTVSIAMGDPAANKCCPIISGLVDAEAAACLCTTLKINTLNLKIRVPVALQLLVTCGKTPPPGFTCAV